MTAPQDSCVLRLADVQMRYGRGSSDRGVLAVDAMDLALQRGELVTLVGPSGCGKSTLLKLVAGLLTPTGGSIEVAGAGVTGAVSGLGMVFQTPTLLQWRSALDNVLLPIELMGRDRRAYVDRARELLAQVGLADFAGRRPAELSGGMQQRVALCRALVHGPTLLLMDEPFSALDELTRESLNDLLLDLWRREQKTLLFVTHSVAEAVYLSDRVVVMSERPGRVVRTVTVPLPRPRDPQMRYETEYVETVRQIRETLRAMAG